MFPKIGKAFVTGAGGFIGSHLVERLVREGAEVTAFVHYNSRSDIGMLNDADPEVLRKIRIAFGDLKDPNSLRHAMRGADVVFHLGALIGIPYSYLNPRDVVDTNVVGTLNVLMEAKELGIRRIVHTSSSEVYGTAKSEKITELHPLQGQSPYSASKIAADKLVESFVASYKLPAVTIRPFNTFGPRQSLRAVIPTIIAQACFQKEIQIGSLKPLRDFTYVGDTVEAMVLGGIVEGVEGGVFNLGTDQEISIGDIVARVLRLIGEPDKPVRPAAERFRPEKSEVFRLRSDHTQAKTRLGWTPKTSFDDGLLKTIEWIRRHEGEYSKTHYVV